MSVIPTVAVTVRYQDNQGQAVEGAAVMAVLTVAERFQGLEVPGQVEGVTDVHGSCVLQLFPNELGSEGSSYSLTITPPLGGEHRAFRGHPEFGLRRAHPPPCPYRRDRPSGRSRAERRQGRPGRAGTERRQGGPW